ncbi:MAG TPA: hypothetical protein VN666_11620, partial [Nitrospira sp.]|nr:hypothetical protein [Nitrospira sp.]
ASSASHRIGRTSWRIRARVRVAPLEGAPSTGHVLCDTQRTDDGLATVASPHLARLILVLYDIIAPTLRNSKILLFLRMF